MTNCDDILVLLQSISENAQLRASTGDVRELRELGMLAPASGAPMSPELEGARARLGEIAAAKEGFARGLSEIEMSGPGSDPRRLYRSNPSYKEYRDQLDVLEKEESALRTRFLDLVREASGSSAGAEVNGERLYITFRGRELMEELAQRRERAGGLPLRQFLAELESVKKHFEERSARARAILQRISPAFPKVDEIHFRMAAVGLSGRAGSPEESAELFIRAYRVVCAGLNWEDPVGVALAENLALRSGSAGDVDYFLGKAGPLLGQPVEETLREDHVRAIAILLACEGEPDKLYRKMWDLARMYCPQNLSAAAFLVCTDPSGLEGAWAEPAQPAPLQLFLQFNQLIAERGLDVSAGPMAAAVLAQAERPPAETMARFDQAQDILSRFNGGGLEVPAAMIAILPTGVEESLDNVRLASASVVRNRLSLGGAENLSLGVKMLMQSSVMAAAGRQQAVAVGPGARPPGPETLQAGALLGTAPAVLAMGRATPWSAPAMGTGLGAFHESTLHRMAVRDYHFHPVHAHYIHG